MKIIFNVFTALSLALLLTTLLMAVGDQPVPLYRWDATPEKHYEIAWHGSILVKRLTWYAPALPFTGAPEKNAWDAWHTLHPDTDERFDGFGFRRKGVDGAPPETDGVDRCLAIPMWFVLLITAVLPISWIYLARRQRRQNSDCCIRCGQDVTGCSVLCSNCGTPLRRPKIRRRRVIEIGEPIGVASPNSAGAGIPPSNPVD